VKGIQMKRLLLIDEFELALEDIEKISTDEEMEAAIKEFGKDFEEPIAISLKDYMDGVYTAAEDEADGWADYIDFPLYLLDTAGEESEDFFVIKSDKGYCVVYENVPMDEDDEEEDEGEEDKEESCCNCEDKDCCEEE
jgi:hypothetical protein